MADGAVKVAVRVRPPFPQEQNQCVEGSIEVLPEQAQLVVAQEYGFTFDYTFDTTATQEDVYSRCVADLIGKVTTGYNCSVLMYGQTGSGKTYTMGTNYGQSEVAAANPGIIPQAVRDLFACLSQQQGCWTAKVSFLEIYNENVFDLLANPKDREAIPIREVGKVIVLPGLVHRQVGDPEEALQCLEQGSRNRSTGATLLNSCSSRSHAIFSIHLQGHVEGTMFTSKLQLVDLAGSEAVKRTHSVGDRRKEGVSINLGLLALGNVINALCMQGGKPQFISYRDSALTRLLRDSLNGSSFTVMIACISPAIVNITETVNTLRYADRARQIKTKPVITRANKENLPYRKMLEPPPPPTPTQWQRTPLSTQVYRRLLPGSARRQNNPPAPQLESTLLGSHAEDGGATPGENASFMSLSPVRPTLPLTPLVERLCQRLEPTLRDDISKKLDSFMMMQSHLNATAIAAPEPTLTEEQQSLVDMLDTTLQKRKRKTMDCTPSRGEIGTPVTVKRRTLLRSGSKARRSGSLGSSPKLEASSSCQQDDTVVNNCEVDKPENQNPPASPDSEVVKAPKSRSPFAVPNPPRSCVANRTRRRTCVFQKRISPKPDNAPKPRVTRRSMATGSARPKSRDMVYAGSAETTQREHNRNVLKILNTASEKHLQCLARVGPKGARMLYLHRLLRGKFETFEDLKKVEGLGRNFLDSFMSANIVTL